MSKTPRRAILLFIPGNPGITSYYGTFFATLKSSLPGLDIVSSNYLGFNVSDGRRPSHSIDLPAQIASRIKQLDDIVEGITKAERESGVPIYLAGHSVGSYICLHVLQARSKHIHRVYLLTPTISDIAKSPQGRILTPLYKVPGFVRVVSLLVWLINKATTRSFLLFIIQCVTKLPKETAVVTMDEVFRDNVIYTVLTLAQSEMTLITAPDQSFWESYARRCSAYWADDDHWVSDKHRAELLGIAKGMESYHCHTAPHAFCIRHGDMVGSKVAEWIRRDVQTFRSDTSGHSESIIT